MHIYTLYKSENINEMVGKSGTKINQLVIITLSIMKKVWQIFN